MPLARREGRERKPAPNKTTTIWKWARAAKVGYDALLYCMCKFFDKWVLFHVPNNDRSLGSSGLLINFVHQWYTRLVLPAAYTPVLTVTLK